MNEIGERESSVSQNQTDTMENESLMNTDISKDSNEEVHTSELSPTEQEYIDYSKDMGTLITEIQTVSQRLDTMTNIMLVSMVGLGLVVGILACNIFARYFIS